MQLDMTKGKPLPVILQFTIPLVIGNIFQQLYNMADTIIVGRYVGAGALAAGRLHRNDHVSGRPALLRESLPVFRSLPPNGMGQGMKKV